MDVKKTKKSYAHYEPDFKEEILRMRSAAQLNSGKNVEEISKTFGISRNVFGRRSGYLVKQIPNKSDRRREQKLRLQKSKRLTV
jgi:transposase-like protein